jgi:hypothetical protein
MTDSDITVHEPSSTDAQQEPTRVYEIRSKMMDERPRFWTGTDFSLKNEEVRQFTNRDEAVLELSGLRAGAYIVTVGL